MKEYKYKINGNNYCVAVNSMSETKAEVIVNGTSYQVDIENEKAVPADSTIVRTSAPITTPRSAVAPLGEGKVVKSPLPGIIISVNVNVGNSVKVGQVVAVLEAMKMENDIQSEVNGTVTAIHVAKGDSILEGTPIVTIG